MQSPSCKDITEDYLATVKIWMVLVIFSSRTPSSNIHIVVLVLRVHGMCIVFVSSVDVPMYMSKYCNCIQTRGVKKKYLTVHSANISLYTPTEIT